MSISDTFFNTYVINLEKDVNKWKNMVDNFRTTKLKLIRFNAIYGKQLSEEDMKFKEDHTTQQCDLICTDGMIGCGLSHIKLAKHIVKTDKNDFSLILEDDVKPIIDNLKYRIIKLVNNTPKDWDIIKIYYHGFCKKPNHPLLICGSTAGYILSKKGAIKLSNIKLSYHIDWQIQQNKDIRIYKSLKPYLKEDNSISDIAENNILNKIDVFHINGFNPISWYFNQVLFKIPIINYHVTLLKICIILFSLRIIQKLQK